MQPSFGYELMDHATVEPGPDRRLREAHLKVTRPRLLLLQLVSELQGHHSADELTALLQERGTPLSRASVYNALEVLVQCGLVMQADVGSGRALYEEGKAWHHHFVCTSCGMVMDIPCAIGEKPCLFPEWVPGVLDEAQVIFRARCHACLARNASTDSFYEGQLQPLPVP